MVILKEFLILYTSIFLTNIPALANFKNTFFDGPVGENGFANLDQGKNMMSNILQQFDPEAHQEIFGEDDTMQDVESQAQAEVQQEIQQVMMNNFPMMNPLRSLLERQQMFSGISKKTNFC